MSRSDKTDPMRTKRTEIISRFSPEITDLKFIRIENDPHWTEFNPIFFAKVIFLCKKSLLDQKLNNLKLTRIKNEQTRNKTCWPNINRFEANLIRIELVSNDPCTRSTPLNKYSRVNDCKCVYYSSNWKNLWKAIDFGARVN